MVWYERSYQAQTAPHLLDALYAMAFLYTHLGRKNEAVATWKRIRVALAEEYDLHTGETVDWCDREIANLQMGR